MCIARRKSHKTFVPIPSKNSASVTQSPPPPQLNKSGLNFETRLYCKHFTRSEKKRRNWEKVLRVFLLLFISTNRFYLTSSYGSKDPLCHYDAARDKTSLRNTATPARYILRRCTSTILEHPRFQNVPITKCISYKT
jgi:hypothetical protein